MSLSRKRKKELRKLQKSANQLWSNQQILVADASDLAREAGRQIGHFNREQLVPGVQHAYQSNVQPVVDKSRKFLDKKVIPAIGGVVGTAASAWDAANEKRHELARGRGADLVARFVPQAAPKKRIGAGGIVAIVLGAAAAAGVLYAAWQTLRADDELWVADDPLNAPEG